MTTLARKSFTCAVCQKESCHGVINSTNAFGSSDLDLRPPEMQRSTMPLWVQECPHCGYTNMCINEIPSPKITKAWLRSAEYVDCEGIKFKSDLAKRFYHSYMVNLKEDETEEALHSVVCAAWACDDMGDTENAIICRLIAAELAMDLYIVSPNPELVIKRSDYLRRAEKFDELLEFTRSIVIPEREGLLKALLAFERKHAEMRDSSCYTVAFALDEMEYNEE